jgi:hypothetical protein
MPDGGPPDPVGNTFRWADARWSKRLDRFFVGGLVLGVAFIAAGNLLVAPANAGGLERLVYSIAAFLMAVLLALGTAYCWALFRAPYEQRDALGVTAQELQKQARTEADRRRHLREDRELTGETFFIWELLTPGEKPVVHSRTFTDCVIKGPALIAFQVSVDMKETLLGIPPVESVLYELVPGERQGLIAFVNCKFVRGRLEGIGYYGDKKMLEMLRNIAVV